YLTALDDESLTVGARFLTGSPFAAHDQRTLSVGWATLFRVATTMFPELPAETLRDCFRAVGDMGETFALLQARRGRDASPALLEVGAQLHALAAARKAEDKLRILEALLP